MKNFIEYYQALTTEECQEIIKYINTTERLTDIHHNGMKKSRDVPMNFLNNANEMEQKIGNLIITRLYAAADLYKKTHNQLERIYTWGVDSSYNLQKYLPNEGYFGLHTENMGCSQAELATNSVARQVMTRMGVWMIYLNNVTKGGTYFDNYDLTLNAVEGRLLIWPAFWTHFHRGIVSKTETKYIATGWFSYQ